MVGVDQAGLAELLVRVLGNLPQTQRQKVLSNILLVGGGSLLSGLDTRLFREVRSLIRDNESISISVARDPIFGAWKGMKLLWQSQRDLVRQGAITRKDYEEYGPSVFKTHVFSNPKF
eukprot:TRINITY_DN5083_c0_g1_i2.p1 TRINITY_DN5083_c0_g1~~TRINITY_DN5083_c0_g1_i2.p1  ORF type:complete len:118 (-),score=4.23 TRINITY_DN5083_c0_g1_i2:119-472(-)